MFAILGLPTSRSFWRLVYPTNRAPALPADGTTLDLETLATCACNAKEVKRLWPKWLTQEILDLDDGRIHLLVFGEGKRRATQTHMTRTWSSPLPEGSLCDLGTGVFVCSPAFTFLLTAGSHSLAQTVAYGDELCGTYSFDPFVERGIRKRVPLATIDGLRRYLLQAKGCPGQQRALRALSFMVEKSASPAETMDEMLMCLPYRLGGYGIELPALNAPYQLEGSAARLARKSICYLDLYWERIGLDVEHHGRYDHSQVGASDADRSRANALRLMGLEVIELTKTQVGDLRAFEIIVSSIAKKLGHRLPSSKMGAIPQRLALRKALFKWSENAGRATPPKRMPVLQEDVNDEGKNTKQGH